MKVVVTNAVVSNTGDAAIFAGIHASLTRQDIARAVDITLLDSNAARTASLYPHWNVLQQISVAPPRRFMKISRAFSRLRRGFAERLAKGSFAEALLQLPLFRRTQAARAYRALCDADLVISTGGTYLVDHYDFSHRAIELELAKRLGKQVILWTQSVGPFESERARRSIRRIVPTVEAAYFRDERSRDAWLRQGGDAERSFTAPDVAFAIDPGVETPSHTRSRVLISVRDWPHRGADDRPYEPSRYVDAMRTAAQTAANTGHEVVALSTCQGLPGYVDDSDYAQQVFDGLPVRVDTAFHTPEQLISELRRCRFVVTTRMHLAILAILTGVPVIAVAYEFKTQELFVGLGLGRFVVPIEDATSAWMSAAVADITADPGRATLDEPRLKAARDAALLPALHLAHHADV
ncbi:polysaccharide pyruvyl transferase family protein [Microbacterium sp. NPDC058345]|uniref:polysaccharide pyruvyl transferase family protein n=1 Tax=Microbacterium sp. NPDC058345 TaxID=3346455 RepID=UPI00365F9A65